MKTLKFIDLFAGLGGFHQALAQLGHECVFASALNSDLAELYLKNFGIKPHGDIRQVDWGAFQIMIFCVQGFRASHFQKLAPKRDLIVHNGEVSSTTS